MCFSNYASENKHVQQWQRNVKTETQLHEKHASTKIRQREDLPRAQGGRIFK